MYIVNAKAEDIYLVNITPLDLRCIYEWYNNEEFKYATGIEGDITLQQLTHKYIEVQYSEDHFWVGIFSTSIHKMIGVLRGQVKYGSKASVWINTLIIDKVFQSKGYGTRAVNLFINFAKMKSDISRLYIAVSDRNIRGYRFWESLGFKIYRKIENCIRFGGETINAIIMYKLV